MQALRGAGQLAAAEDIAFAWRTRADALRGLYLQIFTQELAAAEAPLPADRMARFAAVTDAERSAVGAQNLGWSSYRNKDMQTAIGWFEKAIAWSPDHTGDAKTNEGYALTLSRRGRFARRRISPGRAATNRRNCERPMSPRSPTNCSSPSSPPR